MISLEGYLRNEQTNDLLKYYDLNDLSNLNKWLFETYDEVENISETQFYHNKFNFISLDSPQYWFWQDQLYERLDSSVLISSNIFARLLKKIKGINEIIISNDYYLGIIYNNEFNEQSTEFKSLLNFGNYFIKSKRINNNLANPFYIEARIPKELINYPYQYAYHITNKYHYNKIKKYGLIPKSKSKLSNYDLRIYLWVPNNLSRYDIEMYGHISLYLWKDSIHNNDKHDLYNKIDIQKDLVLLKIDLKSFNEDHKKQLRLFGDPSYNKKAAVFTQEPIPTKYIKEISLYELRK